MTMHIVAGGRRQKNRSACQVFGDAPASGWNAFEDLPGALWIVAQRLGIVGNHIAGRNCIDIHTQPRPFVGKRLRQTGDRMFGSSVCSTRKPP
jgi:hypothetical protein